MDSYIVVIGSTGRIAREYVSHLINKNKNDRFIGISKSSPINKYEHIKINFEEPDEKILQKLLQEHEIKSIFHLATTNTLIEDSLDYHEKINVGSVKLFLELIEEFNLNCPFVYTSTELVFNSKREGQDEESQDFNPIGNYAKSKLMAEREALKYDNSFVIRFGNVIGIENDFLSSALNTLKEKKTYNAWGNVYNRFTYIGDIIAVLDRIRSYKGKKRIFHVACNDPPLSRYEFIKKVIELKNENKELLKYLSKTSATIEQMSTRPQYAVLNTKITEKELNFKPRSIFDCLSIQ